MKKIFRIQVFFEKSHAETRPYYNEAIKWLCTKGFDARASRFIDTFFIYYESSDEKTLNVFKDKIDKHLLALSIRNSSDCAFIITNDFNNEEDAKISTWFLAPPSDDGMQYFVNLIESNNDLFKKLKELRSFNAQVDTRTKLIYGLSLFEEWFDSKPEHCLTTDEQNLIIKKIQELTLDDEKKEKIKAVIKNSNFFSEKNRNQRIAEAVQKYSGLSQKETEDKIRELYIARGKSAHTTVDNELEKNLNSLKSLFRAFLCMEYKFIKLNLH
jgi:hypothetical protein